MIGQIESEAEARRFGDFLYVQKIPNQIDPGSEGRWDIWVHDDDQLQQGKQWLDIFRQNPNDPKFQVGREADNLRAIEIEENEKFRRRMKSRGDLFRRFVTYRLGPLTITLVCACVVVFVLSKFTKHLDLSRLVTPRMDFDRVHWFFFSEYEAARNIFARLLGSPEIRSGEVWRLITPIFIHLNLLHILFNMAGLRDLGSMIETAEGTWKLLALVIVSAIFSNWAQYVVDGPRFGGMSGVIYALFGYIWMKSKYHPASGLYLHKDTITFALVWLVACFLNLLGPIANYAHLGGLIVGVVWGYTESRLLRR